MLSRWSFVKFKWQSSYTNKEVGHDLETAANDDEYLHVWPTLIIRYKVLSTHINKLFQ